MARGASQSQTTSNSRPTPTGGVPHGSPAATAGLRRRRVATGSSTFTGSNNNNNSGSNMLRFYTDDAPGLKISPNVVLVMSVAFIAFVTALHVFGKRYRRPEA
ncbi:protein transport protein Sec61 subunit beta-like [Bidens hawaiensis]|uniref:protein transport protein Sec61 subunit beta-like n=1 Tax=Bidens hawaiensis TaxID=980011 RepID=UPI0040495EE9